MEAPWWGAPVIAGSFLLLGGAIALVSTYLSDQRKAKHELLRLKRTEAAEREKEVRAAAAALLVETREVFEAFKSNFVVDASGIAHEVEGDRVSMSKVQQAYWTLAFLVDTDVEGRARDLLNATSKFNRYGRDSRKLMPFTADTWEAARNRYFKARRALVSAVRDEPPE